jgi:hypothetical protein
MGRNDSIEAYWQRVFHDCAMAWYNYLIFERETMVPKLRRLSLNQIVHLHYRFAFDQPNFLRSIQPPLDSTSPVFQWLERHVPIETTIANTAAPS